jgi:hypothetical protein
VAWKEGDNKRGGAPGGCGEGGVIQALSELMRLSKRTNSLGYVKHIVNMCRALIVPAILVFSRHFDSLGVKVAIPPWRSRTWPFCRHFTIHKTFSPLICPIHC